MALGLHSALMTSNNNNISHNNKPTRTKLPRSTETMIIQHIDKLALILVQNRRQLVVRSKGKNVFFTPGGKREQGESDIEALVRECQEELTIDLLRPTIEHYGNFEAQAFGKPAGTLVRMTCYTAADYEGEIQPNAEIEELKWIASDFSKDQLTVTGIMIVDDLKQKGLID